MTRVVLLHLLLACLPNLLFSQPDCEDLGFGDTEPMSGANLTRCSDEGPQCCTDFYLNFVENTMTTQLRTSLQEEYNNVIQTYLDDVQNLHRYLNITFSQNLLKALPGANFINRSAISDVIQGLIDNYIISKSEDDNGGKESEIGFNTQMFVQNLSEALVNSLMRDLGNGDMRTEACIQGVAVSLVNDEASASIAAQIQVIRQGISTLIRIGEFLEGQREELAQAVILDECITALINLTFCSRCTQRTPPLCFNTCNALLQACYSPYYTTLNDQYPQLWRVARQVVTITNTTVKSAIEEAVTLINMDTFFKEVGTQCGESSVGSGNSKEPPTGEEKDREGDMDTVIPFSLVGNIFELRGAFDYGEEGLQLCQNGLNGKDDDICQEQQENDQRYCKGVSICTSKCDCSDGERLRDTDTEPYLFYDIEHQGNNPVLVIDEEVLTAQTTMIAEGNPIAAFLNSTTFISVVPDGLEGGGDDGSDGGDGDGDSDSGGGAATSLSSMTVIIILCLLFSRLFVL